MSMIGYKYVTIEYVPSMVEYNMITIYYGP
jgi:hypothetical protein